jgi:hypothetical protein
MSDVAIRHAAISNCGKYRYLLTREWQPPLLMASYQCSMLFIMLNPSTADAEVDDPTIRRCMGFARREGCYGIRVVNLFAFRATNPAELLTAEDPVGALNNSYIEFHAFCGGSSSPIVVAWGKHPAALPRLKHLPMLRGRELLCLGTNKDGSPKHPLYVPGNAPLVPWEAKL